MLYYMSIRDISTIFNGSDNYIIIPHITPQLRYYYTPALIGLISHALSCSNNIGSNNLIHHVKDWIFIHKTYITLIVYVN
jgi:hypothetical protein